MCRNAPQLSTGFAALALLFSASAAGAQTSNKQLEAVLKDWSRRHQRFNTVRYTLAGERLVPKGIITLSAERKPLATPLPKEDATLPIRRSLMLDLRDKRFRLQVDESEYGRQGPYPVRRTDTYDGKEYRILSPKDPNPEATRSGIAPDAAIVTGDAARREFDLCHWPLFDSLGIVQSMHFRSTAAVLLPAPDAELLTLHGTVVHQGRRCLVIRTHPKGGGKGFYEEYWVDPTRESAVVKHVLINNKIAREEFLLDYRKQPGGWYLSGWTYTRREPGGKHRVSDFERMRVEKMTTDVPVTEGDFAIGLRPGMVVAKSDLTLSPAPRSGPEYQVKAQELTRLDDEGNPVRIDEQTGEPLPQRPPWGWVVLAVVGTGALTVCFILWRRKRRAQQLGESA